MTLHLYLHENKKMRKGKRTPSLFGLLVNSRITFKDNLVCYLFSMGIYSIIRLIYNHTNSLNHNLICKTAVLFLGVYDYRDHVITTCFTFDFTWSSLTQSYISFSYSITSSIFLGININGHQKYTLSLGLQAIKTFLLLNRWYIYHVNKRLISSLCFKTKST